MLNQVKKAMLKDSKKTKEEKTNTLGSFGEELVAQLLIRENFTILEYNYRKRFGEIDLIAAKRDLIVFVEVKLRRINYFDPSEIITLSKQKKIIKTAKEYLSQYNNVDKTCRFDVAFVQQKNNSYEIEYIEDAFNEVIY